MIARKTKKISINNYNRIQVMCKELNRIER